MITLRIILQQNISKSFSHPENVARQNKALQHKTLRREPCDQVTNANRGSSWICCVNLWNCFQSISWEQTGWNVWPRLRFFIVDDIYFYLMSPPSCVIIRLTIWTYVVGGTRIFSTSGSAMGSVTFCLTGIHNFMAENCLQILASDLILKHNECSLINIKSLYFISSYYLPTSFNNDS